MAPGHAGATPPLHFLCADDSQRVRKRCRFKHVSRRTHRKSAVSEERNGHNGAGRAGNRQSLSKEGGGIMRSAKIENMWILGGKVLEIAKNYAGITQ